MPRNKKEQKQELKTSEIASILGITTRRIEQLTEDSTFKKSKTGYDLKETVRAYLEYKEEQYRKTDDEKRFVKLKCDKLEIELNHLQNEMIPIILAQEAWGKIAEIIRSAIINLPRKAAPIIIGCKSAGECEKLLKEQCYDILNELSNPDLSEIVEMENTRKREQAKKRKKS